MAVIAPTLIVSFHARNVESIKRDRGIQIRMI